MEQPVTDLDFQTARCPCVPDEQLGAPVRLEGIEETLSLGSRQAKEQPAGHLHKLGSQSPSAPQSSRPFLHATGTLLHSCTGCLPTRHRAL